MPSTIANIFTVLSDYRHVTKVNDDISIFYIAYQVILRTVKSCIAITILFP